VTETTLPPMLTDETRKALMRVGRKVRDATAERDRLIKDAVAAGGSLREVGQAVGLTHTAVKFIAHGRPK
jgi:predicted metal-dependent RNase